MLIIEAIISRLALFLLLSRLSFCPSFSFPFTSSLSLPSLQPFSFPLPLSHSLRHPLSACLLFFPTSFTLSYFSPSVLCSLSISPSVSACLSVLLFASLTLFSLRLFLSLSLPPSFSFRLSHQTLFLTRSSVHSTSPSHSFLFFLPLYIILSSLRFYPQTI